MKKELQKDKASLLSQWKKKTKVEAGSGKISKAPGDALIPLTHNQKRLWFLQQLYPESSVYNYSESYIFIGALHVDHLIASLELTFNDHDVLRSIYNSKNGNPQIETSSKAKIHFSKYDFSTILEKDAEAKAHEIMISDAQYAFDLSKHPLAVVSLMKINEKKHRLMLTVHHISTDKWSMDILRKDWARYYKALDENLEIPESEVEIQFSDFAFWQNAQAINAEQLSHWKNKLSGDIPSIHLPTDYPRPARSSFQGKSTQPIVVSKELSKNILQLSKNLEATPYVLFLSVYYILLHKYSGQNDILIGSPMASRDHKALENTIGFFNDTIVLRTELASEISFTDLVREVKKTTLEAFSNKDVPFDLLVKELKLERSLAVNPLFQVMFLFHSVPETPSFADGIDISYEFYNPGVSKFDLTLDVTEEKGLLSYSFEYSTDLFKRETIVRFQEHFRLLLQGIVKDPKQSIAKIPMLSQDDKAILFPEKRDTRSAFSRYQGIHERIEEVCNSNPEKIALTYQDTAITYGELNRRASILASDILKKTNHKNEIVGLCIERSLNMIIGMFAILKAGCAYLPIDPKYPKQRIDFVLKDANVQLLITQSHLKSIFGEGDANFLLVDDIDLSRTLNQTEFPEVNESDLAYIIYTSGSTGNPKGVPITHKNILNSTGGRLDFYPEHPAAFLLMSSISFDSSKAGIFWTLSTGGNLVITEDRIEQDIEKIEAIIEENQVSHTLMLPSLYRLILEHGNATKLDSLTTVIVAGEACPPTLCAAHFDTLPEVELYNEYGPTEATVWCIAHKVTRENVVGNVPLGKPVANAEIYLLNNAMSPVPIGAVGQIYIGGIGLSGGYLHRADLTSETYVKNPFNLEGKLYKTGDLGRYNAAGTIEFLGRSDQQVKIRGYRIELGEIEKAISKNNMIIDVIVIVETLETINEDAKRLAAYVTSKNQLDLAKLKLDLRENMPDYMVPSSIFQVENFPTLPNGKIDKIGLQKLKRDQVVDIKNEAELPTSELESDLLEIWKEVLKIDSIGIHDNFFDLGGDSILSIQFIAKAKKAGMLLSPNQIFDYQTISELAAFLAAKKTQNEEWDYLVALRKEGAKKPLFCIHAGGGHIFFYNVLTKHIDTQRPIYAIQAAGVYAEQHIHESIEQMASDYLKAIRKVQPEGPYNIMVYCFSVAVGHQLSKQLSQQGQVANLIVMDTMADPWNLNTPKRLKMRFKGFVKRSLKNPFKTISDMVSVRWLYYKSKFSNAAATPEEKALLEMNANLGKICKVYDWSPVKGQVSIILTEKEEESINTEIVESWTALVTGDIKVARTKGIHRNLFEEPDVRGVSAKIDEFAV